MENVFNQSIWGDEGFSAILSMKSVPEIIKIIINDTSPPLWNLTEHFAFQLFGTSEIVIRGLAFTYSLLTILFVYKIGALLWNKKTGILAAVLTFLNPFFFTYAFEGRMYSILAFGVTASMYFFLKMLLSKKVNKKDQVGYVIATLWAIYSHHFAIFALFIQGIWSLTKTKMKNVPRGGIPLCGRKWKLENPMLKPFVAVALGYLPWLYPLYRQTTMVGGGFWLGTPTVKDLIKLIGEYLALGTKHDLTKYAIFPVLLIVILRRWIKDLQKSLFLTLWFLGPILLTWLVSQVFQSIFFNRYLLYAIPGVMLILASNRRRFSNFLIGITIIVFLIIDLHYFTHPVKRPFNQLASHVIQTQEEGDFLINWNAASHHLWETKYYKIPAPIYIPEKRELPFFVGTALMEEKDIIHKLPDSVNRIGVVTSGPIDEINLPGYTESEVQTFQNPWEGASAIHFIWYVKGN